MIVRYIIVYDNIVNKEQYMPKESFDINNSKGNLNGKLFSGVAMDKIKLKLEINDVKNRAYTDMLFGINSGYSPSNVRKNRDVIKLVFMTRPQLNLAEDNIALEPKLHPLLTGGSGGILTYIRHLLDPRLKKDAPKSMLIDDGNPFMPAFSNLVMSVSGWPDTVMPTYTSKAGLMKEEQSIADGSMEILNSFDLSMTLRNVEDDPITPTIRTWLVYMGDVFSGRLMPYLDMIIGDEIDYNTRIYTFILGEAGSKIKRVAATGASFPVNDPTGRHFDITGNNARSEVNDINISFKCDGAIYDDVRLLNDFNKTVAMFNPAVRKLINGESGHGLVKIDPEFSYASRYRAIPVVDELAGTLNWYLPEKYVK